MASLPVSSRTWFFRGMRGVISIPGLILFASMTGFAGLARESGISQELAAAMTAIIWALPSQVVLVGSIASGASFGATVLAVVLCSVRLLPMTISMLPTLRGPDTPRWQLYFTSTFVAVTAYVVAMANLPNVPREHRVAWFAGFAITLVAANTAMTAFAYEVLGSLPDAVSAALFFLTPLYFTFSLWTASRTGLERVAFVGGFLLLPLFHWIDPTLDLVLAGLVGGTVIYFVDRVRRQRGEA